ncbi:MAG: porin family protein [Alphaproteobacteria bacterium]|nr:porin family protein [Alphaproteobacteria bacterium]
MKKILLLAGISCLFAFNAEALVLRPYISVKGKAALTNNQLKVVHRDELREYNHDIKVNEFVLGGSAAFGFMLPFNYRSMRMEVEYTQNQKAEKTVKAQKSAPDIDASVETKAVFLNMYYDFQSTSAWVPYIGGGIGGAKLESAVAEESADKSTFAWNVGCGLQYRMSRHGSLDLGYRYVDYGNFKRNHNDTYKYLENDKIDAAAHEVYAGFRITW